MDFSKVLLFTYKFTYYTIIIAVKWGVCESCAFTDCIMGIAKCSCHVRLRGDYMPLSSYVVSVHFIFPRSESLRVL